MKELMHDPREVQLSDLMYTIGMESDSARYHMKVLCSELKIPYPPRCINPVRRAVSAVPITKGEPVAV